MAASWTELDDALAQLLAQAKPLTDSAQGTEVLLCEHTVGRVLAQDVIAQLNVPPVDNSAMDGYALRLADFAGDVSSALPVSQRVAAGDSPAPLLPGTVARIFTGAAMPLGADAVQMQELALLDESAGVEAGGLKSPARVRFDQLPAPGEFIRQTGEDIAAGQVIIPKGKRLRAADVGLAASVGERSLRVTRRPRVALISSGNELVEPGAVAPGQLPTGHIFNSNRYVLQAMLRQLGCDVTDLGVARDDLDATQAMLAQAAQGHDLVLSSGGVSVGEEDHLKQAVQALGELDLWQIAMKPGKPFALGQLRNQESEQGTGPTTWFIGLPGNPVSSFVCFALLVRPFVLALQGAQLTDLRLPQQTMRADFAVLKAGKRREFLRVRRNAQGGLDLYPNQSSGVLTSLAWADGLVDLPAGQTIEPGQSVRFIALQDLT